MREEPKRALKPKQIWEIRFYLNQRRRVRDRALFDLAIDSKLRGCDLVQMKIGDLVSGGQIRTRAIVMQQKQGDLFSSNCSRTNEPAYWLGLSGRAAR
jgi:integrase